MKNDFFILKVSNKDLKPSDSVSNAKLRGSYDRRDSLPSSGIWQDAVNVERYETDDVRR